LKLAPICRSAGGSIMPITPWPHYADHPLALMCRSRPGSYMPVGDSKKGINSRQVQPMLGGSFKAS
jgi:hypothetical protein